MRPLTGFDTITDINGTMVKVDVDINEVLFSHVFLLPQRLAETRTPNTILSQIANLF